MIVSLEDKGRGKFDVDKETHREGQRQCYYSCRDWSDTATSYRTPGAARAGQGKVGVSLGILNHAQPLILKRMSVCQLTL